MQQAIPGKNLNKPGDLEKYIEAGRLPTAPGDLTDLIFDSNSNKEDLIISSSTVPPTN